jgi:hypothetical protein
LARSLKVANGPSAGAWIAPRLHGDFGAVTLTVPSGYAAYARICHPATDRHGKAVSWPEVASETGRRAHALMQWHALVGSPDPLNFIGSLWGGGDPRRGDLAPHALETLCALLGAHTTDGAQCFFGMWLGWAWVGDQPLAYSPQDLLRLPDREYLLLSGQLSAAAQIGDPGGPGGYEPHSPNLFWPADRAWCVASEIDFDSTLIGGTPGLVRAILDAPGLDSWPVGPDDSLAHDADHINKMGGKSA